MSDSGHSDLTTKQFSILEEVGEFMQQYGLWPTPRDLARSLGRSSGVVFEDLERLVDKGELERLEGGRYRPCE